MNATNLILLITFGIFLVLCISMGIWAMKRKKMR